MFRRMLLRTVDASNHLLRVSGVTIDITDRKQAEERQAFLAREVDHRARNILARSAVGAPSDKGGQH